MHSQATRLYKAAAQLHGITGQSAVARFLNESPQTVKNWESRGISSAGAIKAQARLGCDASWLLTGLGVMTACADQTNAPNQSAGELAHLAAKLRALDQPARERAAVLLQGMAHDPDGPWAAWLNELLKLPATPKAIDSDVEPRIVLGQPSDYRKNRQSTPISSTRKQK